MGKKKKKLEENKEKTIREIFDEFNEEQRNAIEALVGMAVIDAYKEGYSDGRMGFEPKY